MTRSKLCVKFENGVVVLQNSKRERIDERGASIPAVNHTIPVVTLNNLFETMYRLLNVQYSGITQTTDRMEVPNACRGLKRNLSVSEDLRHLGCKFATLLVGLRWIMCLHSANLLLFRPHLVFFLRSQFCGGCTEPQRPC